MVHIGDTVVISGGPFKEYIGTVIEPPQKEKEEQGKVWVIINNDQEQIDAHIPFGLTKAIPEKYINHAAEKKRS